MLLAILANKTIDKYLLHIVSLLFLKLRSKAFLEEGVALIIYSGI